MMMTKTTFGGAANAGAHVITMSPWLAAAAATAVATIAEWGLDRGGYARQTEELWSSAWFGDIALPLEV